jgi:hypothetical protein
MSCLDERIERKIRYYTGVMIQWSLITWNLLTNTWDSGCEFSVKIIKALEHAHKANQCIFLDSNTLPYCVKGDWSETPDNTLVYNMENKTFLLHNRTIPNPGKKRFNIVTAELITNDARIDLTEFFNEVSWKGLAAPSLLEMIILYGFHQNHPVSVHTIKGWSIEVMDSDANEHKIYLHSDIASRRFSGWV